RVGAAALPLDRASPTTSPPVTLMLDRSIVPPGASVVAPLRSAPSRNAVDCRRHFGRASAATRPVRPGRTVRRSTVDRARMSELMAREQERFTQTHPRSGELFEAARRSMLAGVPMPWMTEWAGRY